MTGAVILVRHGEPALSRRVRLSSADYRDWWARYEEGGILPDQSPPQALLALAGQAGVVLASTRVRSQQSAEVVTGRADFARDAVFIEAPLPSPPAPEWLRLPPRWWGVISRFCWWFFDYHDGQESRSEAHRRAGLAARRLAERAAGDGDVMVVAHGFFNLMIGRALKAMGWRRTRGMSFGYWSARRYEPPASGPKLLPEAPVG